MRAMKLYQIIFSPTGGTEKVADLLMTGWKKEPSVIDLTVREQDYSDYIFSTDDVCLVAVPSYGGRVPEPAVSRLKEMKGNGAKAILTVVYGNRAYEDTLLELYDTISQVGFIPVAGVAAVAEHSICHQFAAGRPDTEDERVLKKYAEVIREKIAEGCRLNREDVPGNVPYREFGGAMKPEGSRLCKECGICVKRCPAGAIPADTPWKTEEKKCISCMRCVAICPAGARKVNKDALLAVGQKLQEACSDRKGNELLLY